MLQAWLDGRDLGQNVLATGLSSPPTTGTATFAIPADLPGSIPHVLSVMVRDDSHNEDGGINDAQKEGRGLISATLSDATGTAFPVPIAWKIEGDGGGEDVADPVRGAVNNGGLYGERAGWYRPATPTSAGRRHRSRPRARSRGRRGTGPPSASTFPEPTMHRWESPSAIARRHARRRLTGR